MRRKGLALVMLIIIISLVSIIVGCSPTTEGGKVFSIEVKEGSVTTFEKGQFDISLITLNLFENGKLIKEVHLANEHIISGTEKLGNTGRHSLSVKIEGQTYSIIVVITNEKIQESYTVTFKSMGGTPTNDIVMDTSIITAMPFANKSNYSFDGWYENVDFSGSKLITPYNLTKDTIFYAKWIDSRLYKISFFDHLGKQVGTTQEVEHGNSAIAPTLAVEISDRGILKLFSAWDRPFNVIIADMQIKPIYTVKNYTLTFLDSENKVIEPIITIDYGKNHDLTNDTAHRNPPTQDGKIGRWVNVNDGLAPNFNNIKSNIIVKAEYSPKAYSVYFQNENYEKVVEEFVNHGMNLLQTKIPAITTKVGYVGKWFLIDGNNQSMNVEFTHNYKIIQDLRVGLFYTPITYDISLKNGNTTLKTLQKSFDSFIETSEMPILSLTPGMEYIWYTSLQYDKAVVFPFKVTGKTTLFVKEIDNRRYDVKFILKGDDSDSGEDEVLLAYTGNTAIRHGATVTMPRMGDAYLNSYLKYNFLTWATVDGDSNVNVTKALNFYAEVAIKKFNIIFKNINKNSSFGFDNLTLINDVSYGSFIKLNGGELYLFDTVKGDILIQNIANGTPPVPDEDYSFYGWFDKLPLSGASINFNNNYIITNNATYYPKWIDENVGSDFLRYELIDNMLYVHDANIPAQDELTIYVPANARLIPNGALYKVVGILKDAFDGMNNDRVVSIELTTNIIDIESGAFQLLSNLRRIQVRETVDGTDMYKVSEDNNSNDFGLLIKNDNLIKSIVHVPSNINKTTLNISDSITKIEEGAFASNKTLKAVVFGAESRLTIIGDMAFSGAVIESIVLPNSITEIGEYAFESCDRLAIFNFARVNESVNILSIGGYALSDTKWFVDKKFDLSIDVITLGNVLVLYKGTSKTFTLSDVSITAIAENAFVGSDNLEEVIIKAESKLSNVGNQAFKGCAKLQKVVIEKTEFINFGENVFAEGSFGIKIFVSSQAMLSAYKAEPNFADIANNIELLI